MGGPSTDGPTRRPRGKVQRTPPPPPPVEAKEDIVIRELLAARGVRAAASAAGVSHTTVYGWLRPIEGPDGEAVQSPFAARYFAEREAAKELARAELETLTLTAVETLAQVMRAPNRDSMAAVKAAGDVLDRNGITAPQTVTVTLTAAEAATDEDLDAAIEAEMRRKGWNPPDEPR